VYCLLFLLASALSALPFGQCIVCSGQKEEQTIHWTKGRADNTLAKRKSRQYTGQKEEQTIHWPKGTADNTLAKRKSRQCTGQKEE
jgi:phage protein U